MKLNTTRTRALSLRSLRSARNVSRVGSRAWTHAVDPSKTAVVLIEYQNEFTTEGGKQHQGGCREGQEQRVQDRSCTYHFLGRLQGAFHWYLRHIGERQGRGLLQGERVGRQDLRRAG